jgi:hypothetical protein
MCVVGEFCKGLKGDNRDPFQYTRSGETGGKHDIFHPLQGSLSRSHENNSTDIEVLGNIWITGSNVFKASMCTAISLYFSQIETLQ